MVVNQRGTRSARPSNGLPDARLHRSEIEKRFIDIEKQHPRTHRDGYGVILSTGGGVRYGGSQHSGGRQLKKFQAIHSVCFVISEVLSKRLDVEVIIVE